MNKKTEQTSEKLETIEDIIRKKQKILDRDKKEDYKKSKNKEKSSKESEKVAALKKQVETARKNLSQFFKDSNISEEAYAEQIFKEKEPIVANLLDILKSNIRNFDAVFTANDSIKAGLNLEDVDFEFGQIAINQFKLTDYKVFKLLLTNNELDEDEVAFLKDRYLNLLFPLKEPSANRPQKQQPSLSALNSFTNGQSRKTPKTNRGS